ncbi:MAG TPA: hypothetical protein VHZ78_05640 [Rhizomicrobium sp.]|jgi:hypothetical protein|nr:hypothetical protein [Rhizomicrobium sp.]
MRLRKAAALLACLALTASGAEAAAFRAVRIAVPAAASDNSVLRVRAGILPRGAEVDVYDNAGVLLGTVSPFGVHGEAGIYTIPLHSGMTRMHSLTVRLVLTEAGKPSRAPTLREVRGVALVTR